MTPDLPHCPLCGYPGPILRQERNDLVLWSCGNCGYCGRLVLHEGKGWARLVDGPGVI